MATASSFLSEDQFLCSICLEVFTEPVSVPCGHNFCRACISRHWKDKEWCQCPLCNEKFNKGLKLCVNTEFREVVENFKKHRVTAKNDYPVKEGEVPCDCCLGNKFKASKTCLVCLTSYCETHLEPHQRVAALMRHKLTDPVKKLEDKICKKHNRILELFCRDDLTHVCALCTEHRAHDTVPLEEEYEEKKAQEEKEKSEVQYIKLKRHKKAQKKKVAAQTKRKDKDEAIANSVVSNQLQAPNEGPHEINRCSCVPGSGQERGLFDRRFYIEVQTKWKTGWHLGVVRESMRGKKTFKPNFRNRNSNISLRNNTNCMALHNIPVHLYLIRNPDRVWLFVDYEKGLVSFYDADTETLIYSFIGCKFSDKIILFFSPGLTEHGLNCAPLVLSPAENWEQKLQKMAQKAKYIWAQFMEALFSFIFIVFVLVIVDTYKTE
ncbi:zinc-binding protein A33-like [Thunnus maccoyii]|uniref:zinc-binding protein A33-like n=1 Tax=Thunnus maccoyii TaxID=8240 RepID=UPI001C4D6366|nr:zinc-binding protein A33-like [Thunnus maccoyii]XP_042280472.1 zinc-binding protein A33-like [Thunnus maccoyii]